MKRSSERGIISSFDFKSGYVRVGYGLMIVCLAALAASLIYPFLDTIFSSLKTKEDFYAFPPKFLPSAWMWQNYKEGWNYIPLTRYAFNTLKIFAGAAIISLLVISLASFSLSQLKVPYKKAVTLFFLSTLLIPPVTYIIPNFLNLQSLGLINSYWAFWLPAGANAFYILLLKGFFDDIHKELFEAARVDGASEWRCFFQLAVPLSMPIFMTILIFTFTNTWNDWYWPSLIIHDKDRIPIAVAAMQYVIRSGDFNTAPWNVKFSILSMLMVPPVVFFLFFQKYILRGLNLSGIKG